VPQLEKLIAKPFEKEHELLGLRQSVAALEREIAVNIQKKQMAVVAPVVEMEEAEKPVKKKRSMRI